MTWPHQVSVGKDCMLEHDLHFRYDGPWRPGPSIVIGDRAFLGVACEFNITDHIRIGDDCLIASGCKFIDHDHGMVEGVPMNRQQGPEAPIVLENNVWLGANVIVLKGVTIGCGAVVAAGAVVTKSVPPREIWGGVPARKIGQRAPDSSFISVDRQSVLASVFRQSASFSTVAAGD
jgi:acetyltransferase-like isoleucine patch superfamily enzyme